MRAFGIASFILLACGLAYVSARIPATHVSDVEGLWTLSSPTAPSVCTLFTSTGVDTATFYHPFLKRTCNAFFDFTGSASTLDCGPEKLWNMLYVAEPDNTRKMYLSLEPGVAPEPVPGPKVEVIEMKQCQLREQDLLGVRVDTKTGLVTNRFRTESVDPAIAKTTLNYWYIADDVNQTHHTEQYVLLTSRGQRSYFDLVTNETVTKHFSYMVDTDGSIVLTFDAPPSANRRVRAGAYPSLASAFSSGPDNEDVITERLVRPLPTPSGGRFTYSPDFYVTPTPGNSWNCHERAAASGEGTTTVSYSLGSLSCNETFLATSFVGEMSCATVEGPQPKKSFIIETNVDGSWTYIVAADDSFPLVAVSPHSFFARRYTLYPCNQAVAMAGSWQFPADIALTRDLPGCIPFVPSGSSSFSAHTISGAMRITYDEGKDDTGKISFVNGDVRPFRIIFTDARRANVRVGDVLTPPSFDAPAHEGDTEFVLRRCIFDTLDAFFGTMVNEAGLTFEAAPYLPAADSKVEPKRVFTDPITGEKIVEELTTADRGTRTNLDTGVVTKIRYHVTFGGRLTLVQEPPVSASASGSSFSMPADCPHRVAEVSSTSTFLSSPSVDLRASASALARTTTSRKAPYVRLITRGDFLHSDVSVCLKHNTTIIEGLGTFIDPRPEAAGGKGICAVSPSEGWNGGLISCGVSDGTITYSHFAYEVDSATNAVYFASGASLSSLAVTAKDVQVWQQCPFTHAGAFTGFFRLPILLPQPVPFASFDEAWGTVIPPELDAQTDKTIRQWKVESDSKMVVKINGFDPVGNPCTYEFHRVDFTGQTNCALLPEPPASANGVIKFQYQVTKSGFLVLSVLKQGSSEDWPVVRDTIWAGVQTIVVPRAFELGSVDLLGPRYTVSSSGVLTDFTDHLVKIKNSETIQIYSDDEKDIFQYEVKLTPSLRAEVIRDGRNLKGFYSITPEGFVFVGFPAKDESVTSSDNSANARVALKQPMRMWKDVPLEGYWAPKGATQNTQCINHKLKADPLVPSVWYKRAEDQAIVSDHFYENMRGRGYRQITYPDGRVEKFTFIYKAVDLEGSFVMAVSSNALPFSPDYPQDFLDSTDTTTVDRYVPCVPKAKVSMRVQSKPDMPELNTAVGIARFAQELAFLAGVQLGFFSDMTVSPVDELANEATFTVSFVVHAAGQPMNATISSFKNLVYSRLPSFTVTEGSVAVKADDSLIPPPEPEPPTPGPKPTPSDDGDNKKTITAVLAAVLSVAVIVGLFFLYRWWKGRSRRHPTAIRVDSEDHVEDGSFHDLTNGASKQRSSSSSNTSTRPASNSASAYRPPSYVHPSNSGSVNDIL